MISHLLLFLLLATLGHPHRATLSAAVLKSNGLELSFRANDESFKRSPFSYGCSAVGVPATPFNGFLRFAANSQAAENQICVVRGSSIPIPPTGLVISTRIRIKTSTGSESKFTFFDDVIIHILNDQTSIKYVYFDSGFFPLGDPINLKVDNKWRILTFVYTRTKMSMYEDGVHVFDRNWTRSEVKLLISTIQFSIGSSVQADFGNIYVQPMAPVTPPATISFWKGARLAEAPYTITVNDTSPIVRVLDGRVGFKLNRESSPAGSAVVGVKKMMDMRGGASANFRMRMRRVPASEIMVQTFGNIVWRWMLRAKYPTYGIMDERMGTVRFFNVSKMMVGNSWHAVSIVAEAGYTTLYENGVRVLSTEVDNGESSVMQIKYEISGAKNRSGVGSAPFFEVSDIGVNEGLFWMQ